ncbi:alpha-E domain-containing protein [Maricaulis sp.]|uniref:alpha-E domain-containing protein n=1 Tax=Maricaulis sp. TaxID=1486257 RepID=UPI002B269CF0|nr:alpha-E domain-containing protein [Maricaulis sp.]
MLGKHASGLYWMFRHLERSENTARLVEAGFRLALTRAADGDAEWESIVATAGCRDAYLTHNDGFDSASVIDFLLRSRDNPSSVMSVFDAARSNARMVRTALTREVWESVNEGWMTLRSRLAKPVKQGDLPEVLSLIRHQSGLVRGLYHGTMLRNDIFSYARLGTFLERADNTARILDVKYYVLLPSTSFVGSSLDNVQWDMVLRCASAERAFNWLHGGEASPSSIAEFLILEPEMPRSLIYCSDKFVRNLRYLKDAYGGAHMPSLDIALDLRQGLRSQSIDQVFKTGLHEYLTEFLATINSLGRQIETDYRFYE